jgi:hypothetical protein
MRFNIITVLAFIAITLITPIAALSAEATVVDVSKTPLTSRATKVVETYDKALAEAAKEYRKAVEAAKERAVRDLDREVSRETRAGHLVDALRTQAEIKRINAEHVTDFLGNPIVGEPEATPVARAIVDGKWVRAGSAAVMTFTADGKAVYDRGSSKINGTWTAEKDGSVTIKWSHGYTNGVRRNPESKALEFVISEGNYRAFTAVPEETDEK